MIMNLQEIETLLNKYYEGESSLEEEQYLMEYFRQDVVPDHLAPHQEQFMYYKSARDEKLPNKNFEHEMTRKIGEESSGTAYAKRSRMYYFVTGIAASIVILIGVYFQFIAKPNTNKYTTEDTYQDPEKAYAEAKKALLLVSEKFNAGVSDFNKFSSFNQYKELITRKN